MIKMVNDKSCLVVYVCREKDANWHGKALEFVGSILSCKPGADYSLLVVYKGFSDNLRSARNVFSGVSRFELIVEDSGYDIGAYRLAVNIVNAEYICCLSASSRVLCENWLSMMLQACSDDRVGIVGAMGSYESNGLLSEDFPMFPNPHIRTTGFIIRCGDFVSYTKTPSDKMDAHLIESGWNGLTACVLNSGRQALVVGKNGIAFDVTEWRASETFRCGKQSNLLIADHWSDHYMACDELARKKLQFLTWGVLDE